MYLSHVSGDPHLPTLLQGPQQAHMSDKELNHTNRYMMQSARQNRT